MFNFLSWLVRSCVHVRPSAWQSYAISMRVPSRYS